MNMKDQIKMAFDKINEIDEEYSNKLIETFEELPIEEIKNLKQIVGGENKKSGENGIRINY